MSRRKFDLTPAANAGPVSAHRAEAPASRWRGRLQPSRAVVLPGVTSGSLAAALAQTGGGRLEGAGAALLQLQRGYGNRYVQRVVDQARAGPVIQAKLLLGLAEDRYEREADRVAQQATQGRAAPAPDASSRPPAVQRLGGAEGGAVDASVQQAISGARGRGQPLPDGLRGSMEQTLGADFGGVRVHADTQADSLSRALQARAFTTGQDLFFRRGEYNPFSRGGRHLLAHELTHVVQQSGTNGSQLLQRRVGYEFENMGIKLVKGDIDQYKKGWENAAKRTEGKGQWEKQILGKKYEYLARKEEVLHGDYFTLEADDTAGSNVEFVLHGPRQNESGQEKAGFTFRQREEVRDTAGDVSELARKIEGKKREPFDAIELGFGAKKGVIVHNPSFLTPPYLFQATAGIRLDKITEVFSNPSEVFEKGAFAGDRVTKAKKAIAASGIPDYARRNRLVNLLTLIITYVEGARSRPNETNVKEISPIMARTDFATIFSLMPGVARDYLREHLDAWVSLVCAATGSAADKPLSDSPNSPLNEITISAWVREMAIGRDLLKGIDPDKAMGGLGERTDPGNPEQENAPNRQPIFEFRHMQTAGPGKFIRLCADFFDYAARVNKEKRVR